MTIAPNSSARRETIYLISQQNITKLNWTINYKMEMKLIEAIKALWQT